MVGHYWLRNADLAPTPELKNAITGPLADLKDFAVKVHSGEITAPGGGLFQQILLIGIGGSALGPQLVAEAIGQGARLPIFFFDNTDPAGMDACSPESPPPASTRPSCSSSPNPAAPRKPATACSRRKPPAKPPAWISANTPSPSPAMARSSINSPPHRISSPASRWKTGSAAAPRCCPPSAWCPPPCKASISTNCSPVPPPWTRKPASRMPTTTPRCDSRSPGITARTARAKRTWSCCLTRTRWSCSPNISSSSSWSRSARNSISMARSSTRASPSMATRAPPTSTPTSSNSATA